MFRAGSDPGSYSMGPIGIPFCMSTSFDAVDFALYLRSRWRVALIACATALAIAGTAAALLPRRYTATATLIIQPPASADPRAALAVSPVYLESLKTYLNFATSDTLFLRALNELGLRPLSGDERGSAPAPRSLGHQASGHAADRDTGYAR